MPACAQCRYGARRKKSDAEPRGDPAAAMPRRAADVDSALPLVHLCSDHNMGPDRSASRGRSGETAHTRRVERVNDEPRYSRKWFGQIFFCCWSALIVVKVAGDVFDRGHDGFLHWVIVGPLILGFVGAGVPWLVLGARDLFRARHLARAQARPWLLTLVGAFAVACTVLGLQWLGG